MKMLDFGIAMAIAVGADAGFAHDGEDHGSGAAAPSGYAVPADASPRRLADGSLSIPKPAQRQMGLRTVPAVIDSHAPAVSLNAHVVADPNAGGQVQASQPGRIEAPRGGFPLLGARVVRGQLLAVLQPTLSGLDRANQQARLAELAAQATLAEKRFKRLQALDGSVPAKDIEAAGEEAQSLRRSRDAIAAALTSAEPLRAPVSGVISSMSVTAGQVVDARDTLFEVVDPSRLAVEATVFDAALANDLAAASLRLPDGSSVPLAYAGAGRSLREQAVPVFFHFSARTPALAVGQPLTVLANSRRQISGAALPATAVLRNAGNQHIVWVHDSAERFVARVVKSEPLDGARVVISEGIEPGDRVVVQGASLLGQIR